MLPSNESLNTSSSSSSSSSSGYSMHFSPPQSVHKLGMLPRYLQKDGQPTSASCRVKTTGWEINKKRQAEQEAIRREIMQRKLVENEQKLSETSEKLKHLEQLELEVETKLARIKEREQDKQQDLIEQLKKQLIEADNALKESEDKTLGVTERLDQSERARRSSDELAVSLQQEITSLKENITKKRNAEDSLKAELEAEIGNLRAEVNRLQYENSTIENIKRRDDILLQIRVDLLESLEFINKQAFKGQCEGTSKMQATMNDCQIEDPKLFQTMADGQRQNNRQEETFSELEQNNMKWKIVRFKLLGKVRQLQQENRKMHQMLTDSTKGAISESNGYISSKQNVTLRKPSRPRTR